MAVGELFQGEAGEIKIRNIKWQRDSNGKTVKLFGQSSMCLRVTDSISRSCGQAV